MDFNNINTNSKAPRLMINHINIEKYEIVKLQRN
jgi:hypothetical protein